MCAATEGHTHAMKALVERTDLDIQDTKVS